MAENTKVTVLMSVYNGEAYLREAIDSILGQTFSNFEFLIINDGSTDKTSEIIESYNDYRIRIIEQENIGLPKSLNKGLSLPNGDYIARMDADDISLPSRLEKQIKFMDANPKIGISGTWIKTIGEKPNHVWKYETNPQMIKCQLLLDSCLAHPSVIMRRALLEKYSLKYSVSCWQAQDWELWQRASVHFDLSNIPEILLLYRVTSGSVSRASTKIQQKLIGEIDAKNVKKLNVIATPEEHDIHRSIGGWNFKIDIDFLEKMERWLIRLVEANRKSRVYPVREFEAVLARRYFAACSHAASLGFEVCRVLFNSKLPGLHEISRLKKLIFIVKCLLRLDKK